MSVILKKPWTRQPQIRTGPALGNSFTSSIKLLWSGLQPSAPLIGASPTTVSGNPTPRASISGVSPDFAGSQDYRWNTALGGASPTELTLFALVSSDNNAVDEPTVIGTTLSSDSTQLIRIQQRTGGTGWALQSRDNAGVLVSASSGTTIVNGQFYFVVGVWRQGEKSIWVDGVKLGTSSTAQGAITLNQTEIGVMVRTSAVQWWDGLIPMAGILGRALSYAEIPQFSRSYWQLFAPLPRRIWAPAGATGPDVTTALSGASSTVSAGTLATSSAYQIAGAASTVSAGTLTHGASQALAGVSSTVSAGAVTSNITYALSGASSTVSAGTVSAETGAISAALSGAESAVSAGALTRAASVALSGVAPVVSAGTATSAAAYALAGASSTVSAGTLTASVDQNVTLALTGASVTVSAGSLVASGGTAQEQNSGGWGGIAWPRRKKPRQPSDEVEQQAEVEASAHVSRETDTETLTAQIAANTERIRQKRELRKAEQRSQALTAQIHEAIDKQYVLRGLIIEAEFDSEDDEAIAMILALA